MNVQTSVPLIVAILLLQVLAVFLALYYRGLFIAYLDRYRAIDTRQDLEAFKTLAKTNMYGAWVAMVVAGLPIALFVYGLMRGLLGGSPARFLLMLPMSVVLLFTKKMKQNEQLAQNLPVTDPILKKERDRVVDVWMHKAFPDW